MPVDFRLIVSLCRVDVCLLCERNAPMAKISNWSPQRYIWEQCHVHQPEYLYWLSAYRMCVLVNYTYKFVFFKGRGEAPVARRDVWPSGDICFRLPCSSFSLGRWYLGKNKREDDQCVVEEAFALFGKSTWGSVALVDIFYWWRNCTRNLYAWIQSIPIVGDIKCQVTINKN